MPSTGRLTTEDLDENGDPDGYSQAFHAELLLRLGRVDEGMAELTALRPLLSEAASIVSYISEALEAGGRPRSLSSG
jgi:hypothetical protein